MMRNIASTGINWLRVAVPFNDEETAPGQYNWFTTAEISQAVAHGIHVDALLSLTPSWANLPDGSPNPTTFAAFASAAAAHFGPLGVHTYEIWNEPNLNQFWSKTVSAAQYTTLLRDSYTAIKAVDPAATVITAGLSPAGNAADGSQMDPLTFLTQMYQNGAHGYFDAVGIHPYSYPDLPQTPDNWNLFFNLPAVHQLMTANGDGTAKVWLTEYGAPTTGPDAVSPAIQAQMITGAITTAAQWPWTGPVFLFDWQDNTYDGTYGINNSDGTPKPAAINLKTIVNG